MKAENLPIRIRNINAEDVSFVFNSWLKSYRFSTFAKAIRNEIYFNNHHKVVEKIIARSANFIVCDQNDPGQIYGYIVAERVDGFLVVHYLYVKHTYRNLGIGKLLLDQVGYEPNTASLFTHMTDSSSKLAPKYNFVYHPYLMHEEIKEEQSEEKEDEQVKDSQD